VLYCYSQENYPKKIVFERDTVVVITPRQLGTINGIITERNYLLQELSLTKLILEDKNKILLNQEAQIGNYNSIVTSYQLQIDNLNKVAFEQQDLWTQERKKLRKRNWTIGGICLGVGIVGGLFLAK
jgi:dethiobiotin synthetase